METIVFLAVLGGAVMHAGWNAVVKVGLDRFSSVLLLALVQSTLALMVIPFSPYPAPESWGWLVLSAGLHSGYKLFLIRAYEHGDLTQIYPLARGSAPMIVAVVGALFLGEVLGIWGAVAVLLIGAGVVLMSRAPGASGSRLSRMALMYGLITAGFTASYTLVDGVGARIAGSATGFAMWMFIGDGLIMAGYAVFTRGPQALTGLMGSWRVGLIAGTLSLGSYWVAIWAMTLAPIALVASLRETSVLFAMAIGAIWLREDVGRWRWLAVAMIVGGVLVMRL